MAVKINRKLVYFFLLLGSLLIVKQICNYFLWEGRFFWPVERPKENIQVLQMESNCGVQYVCPKNSFALYLSTAGPELKKPKLCVAGKYLLTPTGTNEGMGLNAAVVDPKNFDVITVKHFDIVMHNKTDEILEWLKELIDNDILIMFTSEETSARLDEKVKIAINNLGSGLVQNLNYRSQWYMITQKGTQGFAKYEQITFPKKKHWGDVIEFRGCIPRKVPKKSITMDEPLVLSRRRVDFCMNKEKKEYKGFCNEPRFELIMTALQTNKSLLIMKAYNLPIFVFASKNLEVYISCLDSLIHQAGVTLSLLSVIYEKDDPDVTGIARIYNVRSTKTYEVGKNFEERLNIAREICRKMFPTKNHLIVIDPEVIPSPDFLYFFAQTFDALHKEVGEKVYAISAWSPNCYNHDGDAHLGYRIQGDPKYAALIPVQSSSENRSEEIFVPDVSRVQGPEACHMPSLKPNNWMERPQDFEKSRYDQKLVMLLQLSQVVNVFELLSTCSLSAVKNHTNVVYIQTKPLPKVLRCLGILNGQYGQYHGVIRLFAKEKSILVVTSASSFYKSRPIASKPAVKQKFVGSL